MLAKYLKKEMLLLFKGGQIKYMAIRQSNKLNIYNIHAYPSHLLLWLLTDYHALLEHERLHHWQWLRQQYFLSIYLYTVYYVDVASFPISGFVFPAEVKRKLAVTQSELVLYK